MTLPEGVTLTVVMDCCHSGSILDLPYTIKADEGTIEAVEAGEQSSLISENPGFDFAKVRLNGFWLCVANSCRACLLSWPLVWFGLEENTVTIPGNARRGVSPGLGDQ